MSSPRMLFMQDELVKNFVCSQIHGLEIQDGMYCAIGITLDDKLIAGAVYSEYRPPVDIRESFASISPKWANKYTLRQLFGFPFIHLGVRRMSSIVGSDNIASVDLTERLGFKREGVCRASMDNGSDAIIYGMLKEECRWIK